jgi:hypothetical protein
MTDDPAVLLIDTGEETRHVDEREQRDVERITRTHEPGRLLRRLDVEHPRQHHRLVPDDPDRMTVHPGEPADDRLREVREVLEELTVVDDRLHDLVHVIRKVRAVRQNRVELGAQPVRVITEIVVRRLLEIVLRQERQQEPHIIETRLLVIGHERGHTRLARMAHRTTQLLERHVLTRHRLHHIRTRDEHVRRLAHHEDEIRHRRAVHRTTRTRTQDHRNLRDHPRRLHIPPEDPAITRQRHHTLLDAGTGTIVQPHQRSTRLQGEIHQLVDLLREHLTETRRRTP